MVKNITVYLDNERQECMDRIRCGFIVAENVDGKETFHNDIIDHSEYPSVKELVDDIVGIFKVNRDSVLVAAEDLNYINKAEDFFYESGYRWYHILPDRFVKNPFVIFRKEFWYKILFTKKYQLQNFYW